MNKPNKIITLLLINALNLLLEPSAYANDHLVSTTTAQDATATGYWQTIDDTSKQARSIVKICKSTNGRLYGRIIQVNYIGDEQPTDVCNACAEKDPRYNQANLGMVFLTDMQAEPTDASVWDNGKVLDPKNGKIYNAKITVSDDGKQLTLRGYLGVSLFGRSQTWQRIDEQQLQQLIGKPIKKFKGYLQTNRGVYLADHYDSCQWMQSMITTMSN